VIEIRFELADVECEKVAVVGVTQRSDGRAISGIHRVERFNGEFDACGLSTREESADSGFDLFGVLLRGLANGCTAN
jgi:hypothetical protein